MWLGGVVDSGSIVKGTRINIDAGSWLKSSLDSRVGLVQESGSNQRVEVHIHFPLMECDFSKLVVHVQDL